MQTLARIVSEPTSYTSGSYIDTFKLIVLKAIRAKAASAGKVLLHFAARMEDNTVLDQEFFN